MRPGFSKNSKTGLEKQKPSVLFACWWLRAPATTEGDPQGECGTAVAA